MTVETTPSRVLEGEIQGGGGELAVLRTWMSLRTAAAETWWLPFQCRCHRPPPIQRALSTRVGPPSLALALTGCGLAGWSKQKPNLRHQGASIFFSPFSFFFSLVANRYTRLLCRLHCICVGKEERC